jgi:hypothetical protein
MLQRASPLITTALCTAQRSALNGRGDGHARFIHSASGARCGKKAGTVRTKTPLIPLKDPNVSLQSKHATSVCGGPAAALPMRQWYQRSNRLPIRLQRLGRQPTARQSSLPRGCTVPQEGAP